MENFLKSIWAKILRIALPAAAVVMGSIPGSYQKSIPVTNAAGSVESVDIIVTNYFDFAANGLMDWAPMICMLLCIAAVVCGIVCFFKETENSLTVLANMLCMGLVADLLIMIFLTPTVLGWCIVGVLTAALIITAAQEMKMEDAKRK